MNHIVSYVFKGYKIPNTSNKKCYCTYNCRYPICKLQSRRFVLTEFIVITSKLSGDTIIFLKDISCHLPLNRAWYYCIHYAVHATGNDGYFVLTQCGQCLFNALLNRQGLHRHIFFSEAQFGYDCSIGWTCF